MDAVMAMFEQAAEHSGGEVPRLTAGCSGLLRASIDVAKARGHTQLSTEHLAYALFTNDVCTKSHSYNYLVHMAGVEPGDVIAACETVPGFSALPGGPVGEDAIFLSTGMTETVTLALTVHASVLDVGGRYDLCTEHLVAAMLLTSRCIGARLLGAACDRLDASTFITALGISTDAFRERVVAARAGIMEDKPWAVGPDGAPPFVDDAPRAAAADAAAGAAAGAGGGGGAGAAAAEMPPLVRDEFEQMRGPTPQSNWLVPGKVITGAHPEYNYGEGRATAERIVRDSGVDTFVCFTEWEPEYVKAGLTTADGRPVRTVWFPIDDFDVTSPAETIQMVEELTRLVRAGHVLYMHCLSGRGRTGTVAIPLLLALYPMLAEPDARALANEYKRHGRTGSTRRGHMPEAHVQRAQLVDLAPAYKRGGARSKMK